MLDRKPSEELVDASNVAAYDLFRALAPTGENFVFSPASLWVVMAMAWIGARGKTERQMADVLRFPSDQKQSLKDFRVFIESFQGGSGEDVTLMANSAWFNHQISVSRAFARCLSQSFLAQLASADFAGDPKAAVRDINAWAREHSRGRFRKIVGDVDAMTAMILVNLVYFRGRWTEPFKREFTEDEPFRLAGGATTTVPLMRQKGDFDYYENDELQAVELTYKKTDLAFLALLPRDETGPGAGLEAIEGRLGQGLLREVVSGLRPRDVRVFLPRFTLNSERSCKRAMEQMGLTSPFGGAADFSGMVDTHAGEKVPLWISDVRHMARIEVDEEGTVAAAVSYLEVAFSLPTRIWEFRADHPFLFALRQRSTGAILFLGRLMNPADG